MLTSAANVEPLLGRLHGIFHDLLEDTLQVVTDVNIKLTKGVKSAWQLRSSWGLTAPLGMPPWPPECATSFKRLMVKE